MTGTDTTTIEFTYDELYDLIGMEEDALATRKDWNPGDPNPWTETGSNKIRDAFTKLYEQRNTLGDDIS